MSFVLISICSNEIPIPDIPNEACLLLCPHTTFLSLAFLFDAFAVTDLTPSRLYSLKIPAGQGQLLIPWKESIKDTYLFRKLLRTPLGTEMSDDHLSYDFLRTQLRKVGELTGFAFPVGAYCFRRGNGEALDNSCMFKIAQLLTGLPTANVRTKRTSAKPSATSVYSMPRILLCFSAITSHVTSRSAPTMPSVNSRSRRSLCG